MSLPRHLFTPAFKHQHLGRSFAAIVGIMVFIASFAMAAEAALLTAGYLWGRTAENRLTVEIPAVGDEASMSQTERVKMALSTLEGLQGVERVVPVSDDHAMRLLEPWFKKQELLRALPLPALIDIVREPDAAISATSIEDALKPTIGNARVDDHAVWANDVWLLINGLALLGGLTILLTAITLVIAVSLICRAVVATEHETVSLLHVMGAENADIARHFQTQALKISIKASVVGFLTACVITTALYISTRGIADFSTLAWQHWVFVGLASIAVPFCATGIAAVTARLSVMRLISSFP